MVTDIFEVIGDAITAFAGVLGNGFSSLLALFYNNNAVTTLGILALMGLGVAIVYWAFGLVMRLFRQRG